MRTKHVTFSILAATLLSFSSCFSPFQSKQKKEVTIEEHSVEKTTGLEAPSVENKDAVKTESIVESGTKSTETEKSIRLPETITEEVKIVEERNASIEMLHDISITDDSPKLNYAAAGSVKSVTALPAIAPVMSSGEIVEADSYAPAHYESYESPISGASTSAAMHAGAIDASLAGQLTAGEINDFQKWKMWEDISENELHAYQKIWKIAPGKRYTVLVQNKSGNAVVDAQVELLDKKDNIIWTSRTDNTGKAELWGEYLDSEKSVAANAIRVIHQQEIKTLNRIEERERGLNKIKLDTQCDVPENVELLFTVDATGSMGDEIEYLQAELSDVVARIKSKHPQLKIKIGSVFYRDHGDTYVTKSSDLHEDPMVVKEFIAQQYADGGGDGPEAVDDALEESLKGISWSENARARLMFLILDAPPHQDQKNLEKIYTHLKIAAQKGIRIIPLVASGGGYEMDKSLEYLMRTWALATNGTYAFLTNHSGIGGTHTAPTTDHYEVEKLNNLLIRVIDDFIFTPACELNEWINEQEIQDTALVEINNTLFPQQDSTQTNPDSLNDIIEHDLFVVRCYPNPASDYVMVETSELVEEMFLSDNTGKIIQRIIPNDQLTRLDLTGFPSGLYHVKAWVDNRWASVRIVVAHI